ncbi:MAG: outer membrane protein assembly factor BamA [Bacteroidota bacterium]|jgi:outer membrane protein insertion porin family|nr:outer membrane protein assembly factor BamA [Bacteroidota bacterium]
MQFRVCNLPLILALTLLAGALSTAQQLPQQNVYKVLGMSVEGNITADASAIILTSGIRDGDELYIPGDATAKAIGKLWALRLFSDIQILIDREVGDGVYLKIKVAEYPRLERITIDGNDEFSTEDIEAKIGLIKGQILRPTDFNRIKRKLLKSYEEEGYLLASVELATTVVHPKENRAELTVTIDEGSEVGVERISFTGNEAFDDDDLRGAMDETSERTWWKFWSSARFERNNYEKDKKLIISKYREEGYLDAEIVRDSIWYSDSREDMFIDITVDEGNRSYIRNIVWKGNTVYPDSLLGARLGFQQGDVFNETRFMENLRGNQDQTDVASVYLDNGYLRFFASDERQRVAPDSVDVVITVQENTKSRIGHVHIRGNNKTHDKVIRRVLYTWPGDFFSRAAIIRSIRELATLNYFNPETIRPEPAMVNDTTVDIIYNIEERSSDTFNASVGYSGTFGATGAFGLTFNNFNISEPFRGGAGQVLNFNWQFGEASRFRIFSLSFTEPWFMDTPTSIGFSLYDERQQYAFDMRRTGASVNLGRRFRWPDDFARGDWFVRFQELDVKDGGMFYATGNYTQVSLTQVLSRNSLDSPIFPSAGSRVALTTELSGGFLPGSVDYHKHQLELKWFTPLLTINDQNRLTLYTGTEYGLVKGFGADSYIPPIEYFFMGGNGLQYQTMPLRGYEDRSIGPQVSGQITGGTIYSHYVAELRFAVTLNPMPLYVLGFAEAGNVWLDERFFDPFNLKRSAGFGARLLIQGVGLIGFDYGYGFDDVEPKDGEPDGWHFHFQFGRGF